VYKTKLRCAVIDSISPNAARRGGGRCSTYVPQASTVLFHPSPTNGLPSPKPPTFSGQPSDINIPNLSLCLPIQRQSSPAGDIRLTHKSTPQPRPSAPLPALRFSFDSPPKRSPRKVYSRRRHNRSHPLHRPPSSTAPRR